MMIRLGIKLPKWDEWRKWRPVRRIREAETCTNAIIGYKHVRIGDSELLWFSIYILPLWVKFYLKM